MNYSSENEHQKCKKCSYVQMYKYLCDTCDVLCKLCWRCIDQLHLAKKGVEIDFLVERINLHNFIIN